MKRKYAFVFVLILLLFSVAAVYVIIPRELIVSSIVPVHCNAEGAMRVIGRDATWNSGKIVSRPGGISFRIAARAFHGMEIVLDRGGAPVLSSFAILNLGRIDSIGLQWQTRSLASLNPFRRVQQYRRSVALKQLMDSTLYDLRLLLEKKENVYGMAVQDGMSKDSALLVTKFETRSYPSPPDIYRPVHAIRAYIASQGALEANYPMLHVTRTNDSSFEVMVGIAVNQQLPGNGTIVPKRYVPWKIVSGEVRGGASTAEQAMDRLQLYISDYQKSPMGLPFQSLVTERDREPDTARWVTRVVQAVP